MGNNPDDVRRRTRELMEREGIPSGTDNPTLLALGATPLPEVDELRTLHDIVRRDADKGDRFAQRDAAAMARKLLARPKLPPDDHVPGSSEEE